MSGKILAKVYRRLLIGIAIFLLVGAEFEVKATICNIGPPACFAYKSSELVFVGNIRAIAKSEDFPYETVEVDVIESFFGMNLPLARTINSQTSASFEFARGDQYLFFAGIDKSRNNYFHTGLCSRTVEKDSKTFAEDISFLRAVKKNVGVFWIWGTISEWGYDVPLAGIKAELLGTTPKMVGVSDDLGNIKFEVTKPGKYTVRIHLPKGRTDINGGLRNDVELWQFQRKQIVGGRLKGRYPYVDYSVTVKNDQCGWFDVSIPRETLKVK